MIEGMFSSVELFLFFDWSKKTTPGSEEQVLGTWLRKELDGSITVIPRLENISVEGTIYISEN